MLGFCISGEFIPVMSNLSPSIFFRFLGGIGLIFFVVTLNNIYDLSYFRNVLLAYTKFLFWGHVRTEKSDLGHIYTVWCTAIQRTAHEHQPSWYTYTAQLQVEVLALVSKAVWKYETAFWLVNPLPQLGCTGLPGFSFSTRNGHCFFKACLQYDPLPFFGHL